MMHEFRVRFYLGPDAGKSGHRIIHTRIYLNHERDYLTSTKIEVDPKAWDSKTEKVTLNTAAGHLMNQRLANLRTLIMTIYHAHEDDEMLSLGDIKRAYHDHVSGKVLREGVCSFFRRYIEENGEAVSRDMQCRMKHVAALFAKYVTYVYHVGDIGFEELDHTMIEDFWSYLCITEGYTHPRTLKNKVSILRTLVGASRELGMMHHDPFEGYTSHGLTSNREETLSIEEIRKLKKVKFGSIRLERVRDCFLFSCHTGLSYREVKTLTCNNLTKLNGTTWIVMGEDKPRYIPLLPYPASVIERYRTDDPAAPLLPMISQQKTNRYLKDIAEACGIAKPMTYNLAVRSFMKLALTSGASIDSVSHIMGKTVRHVGAYVRCSPERLEEEMAILGVRLRI